MTEYEVMEKLRAAVDASGGLRAFAKQHQMTAGYVSDVLHGRRAFADRILKTIHIKRYRMIVDSYVEQSP